VKCVRIALCLICVGPFALAQTTKSPQRNSNIPSSASQTSSARRGYVGDAACQPCHSQIADAYERTSHHLTSQPPSQQSILGSFAPGKNVLKTSNPDLQYRMESRATGFFEVAVFWQPPHQMTQSERIDIVTGSGTKGQTYLYWKGNALFQLPVSYWTTDIGTWVNSPGFSDGIAEFQRPIFPRCLECHATYFASASSEGTDNHYLRQGFVLGISCERCHGPGRAHVTAEQEKRPTISAGEKTAIVNPASLPRDRQMEVCAQCHGGPVEPIAPAFTYIPGQPLNQYFKLAEPNEDARVDVHGNQVALTQRSRCYQSSQMTCITCHDVHAPEREAADYSEKCLHCHKEKDCGEFAKLGPKIRENCVDCHMPVQDSDLIISEVNGKQVKARMRNHWIKVYPESAQR